MHAVAFFREQSQRVEVIQKTTVFSRSMLQDLVEILPLTLGLRRR